MEHKTKYIQISGTNDLAQWHQKEMNQKVYPRIRILYASVGSTLRNVKHLREDEGGLDTEVWALSSYLKKQCPNVLTKRHVFINSYLFSTSLFKTQPWPSLNAPWLPRVHQSVGPLPGKRFPKSLGQWPLHGSIDGHWSPSARWNPSVRSPQGQPCSSWVPV